MLKEGKMSRPRALRLLDHALGGEAGVACCEKLVEAAGLKILFTMFMKKVRELAPIEHILGIFASMLRLLLGDSAPRIRLLGKFVEKDYEKLNRIVKLRREYASKLAAVDRSIKEERAGLPAGEQQDHTDEWLSRRLDAGLFSLQSEKAIDVILAWLIAEDDGARSKIRELMAERDETFSSIKSTLEEQLDSMSDQSDDTDATMKDMLSTLIQFL
ncbi:MAG: hypothetical protein Q9187_007631 [Circinaria calcarea]